MEDLSIKDERCTYFILHTSPLSEKVFARQCSVANWKRLWILHNMKRRQKKFKLLRFLLDMKQFANWSTFYLIVSIFLWSATKLQYSSIHNNVLTYPCEGTTHCFLQLVEPKCKCYNAYWYSLKAIFNCPVVSANLNIAMGKKSSLFGKICHYFY